MGKIIQFANRENRSGEIMYTRISKFIANNRADKPENIPLIANQILKDLDIQEGPTPIVEIMRKFGFRVFVPEIEERNISGIIGIDENLKKEFDSDKIICINAYDNIGHQRFTLAHELAHYLFDYIPENKPYYSQYNTDIGTEDYVEQRANTFAANLLMPKKLFLKQYEAAARKYNSTYERIDSLANYFKTSPTSVEKRMKEVGIECFIE